MFHKADVEGKGLLDLVSFKLYFSDPIVQAFLRTMDIEMEIYDLKAIFNLFAQESGHISLEAFLVGCMHVRGKARSTDLLFQFQALHQKIFTLQACIDSISQKSNCMAPKSQPDLPAQPIVDSRP